MKTYISKGIICASGPFDLIYRICDISYYLNSDDSFKYVFSPNYPVIELIGSRYFQGIPGLDLDLKKGEYVRENRIPTFISERVPSEKREDYSSLLTKVGMEYMDPIEYLIRSKEQYSGDKLFLLPYEGKKTVSLDEKTHETNAAVIKKVLKNVCFGNDVIINNQTINDGNRKMFHDIFLDLYSRSYEFGKEKQKEGIAKAKEAGRYKGRKPIAVDEMKFVDVLSRVERKKITPSQAAKELGISIDKYYRLKRNCKNKNIPYCSYL